MTSGELAQKIGPVVKTWHDNGREIMSEFIDLDEERNKIVHFSCFEISGKIVTYRQNGGFVLTEDYLNKFIVKSVSFYKRLSFKMLSNETKISSVG